MNRDETVLFVQIIVTNSRKFLARLSMVQYGRELVKNVGQELGIIGQKAGCRRGLFAVLVRGTTVRPQAASAQRSVIAAHRGAAAETWREWDQNRFWKRNTRREVDLKNKIWFQKFIFGVESWVRQHSPLKKLQFFELYGNTWNLSVRSRSSECMNKGSWGRVNMPFAEEIHASNLKKL